VTRGFDSSKQRDTHEATHERKFRCGYSSCASFSAGFATKSALKRHNDKYHTAANTHSSLSMTLHQAIALPEAFPPEDILPIDVQHGESNGWTNISNEPTISSPQQDHRAMEPKESSLSPRRGVISALHVQNNRSYATSAPTPQHLINGGPPPRAPEHPSSHPITPMHPIQSQQSNSELLRTKTPNATGQIQQFIFNTVNLNTGPLSGWQAGVLINERMNSIFNL